jgi:hypothetical protein
MASLTGQLIKDTYQSLLKVDDNGQITNISKNITDGLGGSSGLYLTSTGVIISGSLQISGSLISDLQGTASYAQNSNIANSAYTASSADNFIVRGDLSVADTVSASSFIGDGSQLTGISGGGSNTSRNWLTSTTLTVLSSDTATFSTDFVAEDSTININSENKQYTIGAKTISKRGSIFISDDALLLDSSIVNNGVISVQGALILSGSTTITGTGILI